ncbi:MAG: hypothetical protein AB8B95_01105 [Pseudohongiellaceae bacterium]
MKIIDFKSFAPFNSLREKMGNAQLGYFELFDPVEHLNGAERSQLSSSGRFLALSELKILPDKTLAFKNSRVLIYAPYEAQSNNSSVTPTYHVANCSELEQLAKEKPAEKWLATTRISKDYELRQLSATGENLLTARRFTVCKHCLHSLRYKNYEEFRNRRRGYSEKVLNSFSLSAFYRLYPQYPLGFKAKRADID